MRSWTAWVLLQREVKVKVENGFTISKRAFSKGLATWKPTECGGRTPRNKTSIRKSSYFDLILLILAILIFVHAKRVVLDMLLRIWLNLL
jgi:hypothetical protein